MTAGLPPPHVVLSATDGTITVPWYRYQADADVAWRVKVNTVSSGPTVGQILSNRGVDVIATRANTTHILATPEPGCRKVIIYPSSENTGKIVTQTTTVLFHPGGGWRLNFSTTVADKVIELVGTASSAYYIVSNPGAVVVST